MTAKAGPDGYIRSPGDDAKLNKLFATVFSSAAGEEVIRNLRSITIEAVGGPEITDSHLRHLEGMRYLVGIIQRRIKAGQINE